MKKSLSLLVPCFLLVLIGCSQEKAENKAQPKGTDIYVLSVSGINLRQEPSSSSKALVLVPYGTKLTVMETSNKTQEIDNFKGTFVKVSYQGKTGYLFDGFCAPLPAPDLKKPANLDAYAAKYLGKGKKIEGGAIEYQNGITYKAQQTEGYSGHGLIMSGITPQQAFLVGRAVAASMDTGFTGKEPFPKKDAKSTEKYKGKNVEVEVNIVGGGGFEYKKTVADGGLFMVAVKKDGARYELTLGSAH